MADYEELIRHLDKLGTECINENTIDIDQLSAEEIATRINVEDKTIADVVATAIPQIASAAKIFADTLRNQGRVFYAGAGTSGRLGVLDAAECPPTFGTDPDQIIGVISGGYDTLVLSQEGVEDRIEAAISDLKQHTVQKNDFVIGLAASRRTPYTLAALEYAQSIDAKTAFIICNQPDKGFLDDSVIKKLNILIALPVGPEVITGSTRMKSATAQKMTLNMISTTAMVLLGKTYGNLMVDLQARSDKLAARSRKILIDLFDVSLKEADQLLMDSDGSVKVAIVMKKYNCHRQEAEIKIYKAGGFISRIV